MSIIIRLQNLPWSANSMDIRKYFHGLSIPEGGVHIVGGEKGDAFIAFSTDEDARQAMEKDSGKIKDTRVKLMLSSRAEMQKVIEQARTQNMALQQNVVSTQPLTSASQKAVTKEADRRLYFTGSAHFNRSMRLLARKKGMALSEHSLRAGVIRKGPVKINEGYILSTPTEESVFIRLGLEYRTPEERDH